MVIWANVNMLSTFTSVKIDAELESCPVCSIVTTSDIFRCCVSKKGWKDHNHTLRRYVSKKGVKHNWDMSASTVKG